MSISAVVTALMIAAGAAMIYLGIAGDALAPSVRATIRFGVAITWFVFAWYIWTNRQRDA